ncbi:CPBP family intramembrane metalloprotease [Sphaerisporangium sp. TRM90804]|uniref:CPBP family intramembrane glutamic endopeptidase n=1 Tax=Sphaerisporangium sp. TRM90804 TaxID=3031113 RepID=UPI002447D44E|nr:CPBP family intramembrane metalloprotease [Sphaerisporangium sp. TRM90804]MDH2423885.1 CPBP family intramembrane metalloprotease [Sphaerisporangium sp. TRM90804]
MLRRGRSGPRGMLVPAVAVLAAANVVNNRVAPRLGPVTSAAATGALVLLARRSGLSWAEMGFERRRRGAVIGGALATAVAAAYAGGLATSRTRALLLDDRALALSRARLLEEILVQVPIGTVLLEEVAFRGVLPAALGRAYGPVAAVAGSSALFGLWHILPSLDMADANPALGRLTAGESPGRATETAPPGEAGTSGGRGVPAAAVVVGSVISTGVVGVFFQELRWHGGLLAPSLTHLATNSLGYVAARVARRVSRAKEGKAAQAKAQAVVTTWNASA